MDKTELCEAVKAIKEQYRLSYAMMCREGSPVNTTQLGHILKRNGENVSVERIVALLDYYGVTTTVNFDFKPNEED